MGLSTASPRGFLLSKDAGASARLKPCPFTKALCERKTIAPKPTFAGFLRERRCGEWAGLLSHPSDDETVGSMGHPAPCECLTYNCSIRIDE